MLKKHLQELETGQTEKTGKDHDEKSKELQQPDEDKNLEGLREIFAFYCKQQIMIGPKPTFEQLHKTRNNMNMGEFLSFCKDFKVPLLPIKLKEIFKKTAILSKDLDWDNFLIILQKTANLIVEEKIEEITKKIKQIEEEKNKDENNQQVKDIPNLQQEISVLAKKPDEEKLADLYKLIECDNVMKFKRKMAGMSLPFNTRDKKYRIPLNEGSRQYKFVANKTPAEIKQEVRSLQKKRIEEKEETN